MDETQTKEFYFILSKFLKDQFPEIGLKFIEECEKKKLYPSCVFSRIPSFNELDNHALFGLPNDQLVKILSHALSLSNFQSLLVNTEIHSDKRVNFNSDQIIINKIGKPTHDLYNFGPSKRVTGHFKPIYCTAIDYTSQILITGSDDTLIKVWSVPQLNLICSIHAHQDKISDISIHPSNKFIACSSDDNTITFIALKTCQVLYRLVFDKKAWVARFSPDGKFLATACEDGYFRIYSLDEQFLEKPILVQKAVIESEAIDTEKRRINPSCSWVSFSPGSRFVILVSESPNVIVYDLYEHRYSKIETHSNLERVVDDAEFTRNNCRMLYTRSSKDKNVIFWEFKKDSFEKQFEISPRIIPSSKSKVEKVCIDCTETNLICITKDTIIVNNLVTKQYKKESIAKDKYKCVSLTCHPTNPNIVSLGFNDGTVVLYDISQMKELYCGRVGGLLEVSVTDSIWSPEGRYFIVTDARGCITLFNNKVDVLKNTDQFFKGDDGKQLVSPVVFNSELLNREGIPLNVQPKLVKMNDVNIDYSPPLKHKYIYDNEVDMSKAWEKEKLPKLLFMNGVFRIVEEQNEENESERSNEENIVVSENEPSNDSEVRDISCDDEEDYFSGEEEDNDGRTTTIVTRSQVQPPNLPATRRSEAMGTRRSAPIIEDQILPRTRSQVKSGEVTYRTVYKDDYSSDFLERADRKFFEEEEDEEVSRKPKRPPPKPKTVKPKGKFATRNSTKNRRTNDSDFVEDYTDIDEFDYTDNEPSVKQEVISKRSSKKDTVVEEVYQEDMSFYDKAKVPEVTTMPYWMLFEKREQYQFIPQIGEKIVYLKKGHQSYHEQCYTSRIKPPYRISTNLPDVATGFVIGISVNHKYLLIDVSITHSKGTVDATIAMPLNESYPFIVPHELYERSLKYAEKLYVGKSVSAAFIEENNVKYYTAKVCEIDKKYFENPYDSISINVSGEKYNVCPWELELKEEPSIPMSKFINSLKGVVNSLAGNDQYSPIKFLRSEEQKQIIWDNHLFPMDLELFINRLNNGWYQTVDEILVELRLFTIIPGILNLDPNPGIDFAKKIQNAVVLKAKVNSLTYNEDYVYAY